MKAKKDWSDKGDKFVHHWRYYEAPARPSPSDIEFIKKKILEKGKKARILILGATPEYRNLCGELGIPMILIDFSRYNYEYLAREVKNRPKEIFVEGNWLTAVLHEKFDIILADNVINVLMKKDIKKLFLNVRKMLKKDGLFMPRIYVREKGERYTGEEAIREWREERKGQSLFTATERNLLMAVYDFKKDIVVFGDEWEMLKKLRKKGIISDDELEGYRKLALENSKFKFFIPLREELNKALYEFFVIEEIFNGTERYLMDKLPLYVLIGKNP